MTTTSFQNVRNWLAQTAALDAESLLGYSADQLIQDRMTRRGMADETAYLRLLQHEPEEIEHLIEEIAVPETWFFRYPKSFQLLRRHLQSLRVGRPSPCSLRMLSVACATGEEPCSMSITAAHAGWELNKIVVDAIDCNRRLVAKAKQGIYGTRSVRRDVPHWTRAWLTITAPNVQVAGSILTTINYVHGDVLRTANVGAGFAYHVIFCRNLLIYLDETARGRLIQKLSSWLAPDGLLFVGHAERVRALELFRPVPSPHAFAFCHQVGGDSSSSVANLVEARTTPRDCVAVAKQGAKALPRERPTTRPATAITPQPASLAEARKLADRGQLEAALTAARTTLAGARPSVELWELLGTVQLALGREDEARTAFRKAVYLDPNHEQALFQLALLSEQEGNRDRATRYRRRAERAHKKKLAR